MTISFTVDISYDNYANPDEAISAYSLGTEFLGWEPGTQILDHQLEHYDFSHLRTPGGLPAEDPWQGDGEASRISNPTLDELKYGDFAYDLADPNFVDWYRWTGEERECILDITSYAIENDISSLAFVVPTARYAARMFDSDEDGSLTYQNTDNGMVDSVGEAVSQAKSDMLFFLNNYFFDEDGNRREVTESLTIELGSEYYETNLWKHFMGGNFSGDKELALKSLTEAFGLTFAAQAEAIGEFEAFHGIEINTAVQLGRTQANDSNFGSFEDNFGFLEQFLNSDLISEAAIHAIDAVIWHRYTSFWDSFDDYLDPNDPDGVLAMIEQWENAGAGNSDGLDLIGGWMAPSLQVAISESKFHLSPMLQLYAELMAAGMDMGTAFGGNLNNIGSLGFKEDLFMGGQLYGMMNENIVGTYIQSGFDDNMSLLELSDGTYIPAEESDQVNKHIFSNAYKIVLYLTVGDIPQEGLAVDLVLPSAEYSFLEFTHLFAAEQPDVVVGPTGNELGYGGEFQVETIDLADGGLVSPEDTIIHFIHDFELVEVVAYKTTATSAKTFDLRDLPDGDANFVTNIKLTGSENVRATGNERSNIINGNDGNNNLWGMAGNDVLFGHDGDDRVFGNDGNDRLSGNWGNDRLSGGSGHDKVWGGFGDDLIFLAGGSDAGTGGPGSDTLYGGGGNDYIDGSEGADALFGGGGRDTFVFRSNDGDGDIVFDFEVNKDKIRLVDGGSTTFEDLRFDVSSVDGQDSLAINYESSNGGDVEIQLVGLELSDIWSIDFLFG